MLYNNLEKDIYILHENSEWLPPFYEAFKRVGASFSEIDLSSGSIDLSKAPPKGVFFSRMSASSHTRNHKHAKEYARAIFAWLESYNRRIINGPNVLELEISKVAQYLALSIFGFRVPRTLAVFGKDDLLLRAKELQTPFITKHNQGGKGLGVRLFESYADFEKYATSSEFESAVDNITLLQEYIKAKDPFITRLEFIGGKFFYAVKVDTSDGGFELCPAESCEIDRQEKKPALASAACDIGAKFSLREDITANTPLVVKLESFLQAHKIEVAGIEFIDTGREIVIYDINTNTNYNQKVESNLRANGKQSAADRVAEFLIQEFKKIKE